MTGQAAVQSPMISVMVPVYNKAPYLPETLHSLLVQDLENFEIICVDDGSTDQSLDILREFAERDGRIRVAENSVNMGAGPSRNCGLQMASGCFVQFVDADDVLPSHALQTLYKRIRDDGVQAVKGNIEGFTDHGPDNTWILTPPISDLRRVRFSDVRELWIPWYHVTWLFDRAFLQSRQIFYPALRTGEDPVFLAEALAKSSRISAVADVCYRYRTGTFKAHRVLNLSWMLQHTEHAARVKDIFAGADLAVCWHDSYAEFSLKDLVRMGRNATLSESERQVFEARLSQVYGDWPGWARYMGADAAGT